MRALCSSMTARTARASWKRAAGPLIVGAGACWGSWWWPSEAAACGPCNTPELWDLHPAGGALTVVANFGLLTHTTTGWRLTCEELFGGLLLSAQANQEAAWVSTENGVFWRPNSACDWVPGPRLASNRWAWKFSIAAGATRDPWKFALVIDAETQALNVERSRGDGDFSVVHGFDKVSGFRDLIAGGEPASVFVSGYAPSSPRPWQVAFSPDGGDAWETFVPDAPADTNLVLRWVDPAAPRAVFVESETLAGLGEELWRFDAESGEMRRLLRLDDGELLGGISLDGDTLWVAGQRADGGSLYRADRESLEFTRERSGGPRFSCLAAEAGTLYACVNDFGYASPFIVARSTDAGESWQPLLTVDDLGALTGCASECQRTLDWLDRTFADTGSEAAGGAEATGGTDAVGLAGAAGAPGGGESATAAGGGCQCHLGMTPMRHEGAFVVVAALGLLGLRRRRSAVARAKARAALGFIGGLSLACSQDDSGETQARAPGCEGRGQRLEQLEVESEDSARLRLLATTPEPPIVGDNAWFVEIVDAQGQHMVGLSESLRVTPFMPDHQHGSPVAVHSEELEPGQYRLAPVNTFMPGLWQITLNWEFDDDPDSLTFAVCVE